MPGNPQLILSEFQIVCPIDIRRPFSPVSADGTNRRRDIVGTVASSGCAQPKCDGTQQEGLRPW